MPLALSANTYITKTQWVTPGPCPALVPMGTQVGANTPYPVPVTMEPQAGEFSVLELYVPPGRSAEKAAPPTLAHSKKDDEEEEHPAPKRR